MKSNIRLLALLLSPIIALAGNPDRYEFKTVKNDPYNVLQYELANGLKVYLSVNKDEPRISTNIAVRTGSKNDPPEVTGLAHYLEHMLFKGTSNLASLDWEKEKVILKQISDKYEEYRKTSDKEQRRAIYAEIDRLSGEAAQYVATNEYDQMISELGAKGTNAYTSLERTVYINDIPSNEIEKWMMIEAERFGELTLRLFHTELEAVYEEFNRNMDSDRSQAYMEKMRMLYPGHTYGSQTTIGTSDHLKNPSMEKIHEYFEKYYVPNNMAIIMVGNLDPDETVRLIEKYFGPMKKGPTPDQFQDPGLEPMSAPLTSTIEGSEAEFVSISYRVKGMDSGDDLMADLASSILNNGKAGIIDTELNQKQKVIRAYAYQSSLSDYTEFTLGASPRADQTLEEAKQLLLEQVGKLKNGDFDETLIQSIVRNSKRSQMRQNENNNWKAYTMINAFIFDLPWNYYSEYYDRLGAITKDQLVSWANDNLGDNFLTVFKRKGERTPPNIDKPTITPVNINRGKKSGFRENWEKLASSRMTAQFIDFETDVEFVQVKDNLKMYYVKNTTNQLFELEYIFDMGSRNDKILALAVQYLPYLGTPKYSVDQIKRKFYDLALDYSVYAGSNRLYVTLNGLDESMEDGIALFEELLTDIQANPEAYGKMVDGMIKKRENAKLNKSRILYGAMRNYAQYGMDSPFRDILSEEQLRGINPEELTSKLKELRDYKHKVFYYGPKTAIEAAAIVKKNHKVKSELKGYPTRKEYKQNENTKNLVYIVDYDQVQAEILMLSKGDKYDPSKEALTNVFNQYFGAGLSSIVFQEIRESKALAYSAYSFYTTPGRADENHFIQAYVGTQNDKLKEAVGAMQALMNDMPQVEGSFEQARIGALKKMETSPTTKSDIFWSYVDAQDKGLSKNPEPEVYEKIQKMNLDQLQIFFDNNIKGRKYTFLVIGKKDLMDMEALNALGEVQELDLETIFGY